MKNYLHLSDPNPDNIVNPPSVRSRVRTERCVHCGCTPGPTGTLGGHLIAYMRMALGNYERFNVLASWCSRDCHDKAEEKLSSILRGTGCYGNFSHSNHGLKVFEDILNPEFGGKDGEDQSTEG